MVMFVCWCLVVMGVVVVADVQDPITQVEYESGLAS
jgi:hypothetical protein